MPRSPICLATLLALLLPSCDTADRDYSNAQSPPEIAFSLTEANGGGGPYPIRPGQAFEVRLRGNATIDPPLVWTLASASPMLRRTGQRVVPDDPQADGAGATWIFRFAVIAEGEGELVFIAPESRRRIRFGIFADPTVVYD